MSGSSISCRQHERTEFLVPRDGVNYLRCIDCDQVFEADDLEHVATYDDTQESTPRKKAS